MGRRQKTPGPGAYDVPKHLVIGSPDPRLSSNFASKVPRTLHHTDHFGDPGQYDLQKAAPSLGKNEPIGQSIGSSFNETVKSGRASFNTRGTGRARSAPPRNQRGGPGEYDFDHLYRVGATATSPGGRSPSPSSSFRSKTPLGGHVRKSDTPGVGRYDPKPQYAVGGGATSGGNEPGKKSAVRHVRRGGAHLAARAREEAQPAAPRLRIVGGARPRRRLSEGARRARDTDSGRRSEQGRVESELEEVDG